MASGITPKDEGSQAMGSGSAVFEGSGIRLYHFCGIRDQNGHAFGIKDQIFGYKNGISVEKKHRPRYDFAVDCQWKKSSVTKFFTIVSILMKSTVKQTFE